jgi:hypothetical protein
MAKFGIENLKILIALPIEMGNIAGEIIADSDKSWKRWLKFIQAVPEIIELMKIDWKMLKEEYLDLDDVERGELKEMMKTKFDIPDDKIESIIENSFSILFDVEASIRAAITLFASLKN